MHGGVIRRSSTVSAVRAGSFGWWAEHVPLVAVLRSYRRADLPHDLTAGLVLGMVTVPQAVAYAFLAGLPAQAGLYASLLPIGHTRLHPHLKITRTACGGSNVQ